MQISENIKKFRELKNITRDKIASELNMSLSNYSKIERGEIDLTLSRITEIAKILEVSILQLMNFDSSQIFNISNNDLVHGVGAKSEIINFNGNELQSKYIENLEEEVKLLKAIIEKKIL
jgi:transcriptional regulator with XRE-family HTH domain